MNNKKVQSNEPILHLFRLFVGVSAELKIIPQNLNKDTTLCVTINHKNRIFAPKFSKLH